MATLHSVIHVRTTRTVAEAALTRFLGAPPRTPRAVAIGNYAAPRRRGVPAVQAQRRRSSTAQRTRPTTTRRGPQTGRSGCRSIEAGTIGPHRPIRMHLPSPWRPVDADAESRAQEETMDGTRIIVGFDGSDESRRAVDWAADEAERTGAPLQIVHAYQLGWPTGTLYRPTADEAAQLRRRAKEVAAGVAAAVRARGTSIDATVTVVHTPRPRHCLTSATTAPR
ncbi:universal stress protein [Dactylosporangium sp. CS-047395]|uniref:universal stress protein n=1 Tax=Dactylosporangium sp. CS-047395 TaxID=3239936 RepID=UPI003D8A7CC6